MRAAEIPVAHTPDGGWTVMPDPILMGCTEEITPGAPDLRGTWRAIEVESDGGRAPDEHPLRTHVERIEQCADRVVVTAAGVIHDMRADGTVEHGVNDVTAGSHRPIRVVATFEDGALTLRPVGIPGITVTRRLQGDRLVFSYGPSIVVTLERV
jgi:hypothetical protein